MNQITREDVHNVLANDTDAVELVEFRRDGINFYITLFTLSEDDADKAMEALEEKYALRIKTIKHEDEYVKIHYVQSETAAKKEVKMNTINFVGTPDGKIIVINSTPTKRALNMPMLTLLPAESQSTMRDRKIEREAKEMLGFKPAPRNDQQIKESQVPAKTTPSIQAEIDKLKHLIATLTPEAHAEAVKQGLIRGAQAQFNRETHSIKHVGIDRTKVKGEVKTGNRSNAIGKRQRAEVIKRECACGCGQMTGGNFAMGHDARAKGQWLRQLRGTYLANEIGWTPTAALVAYAIANPQWSAEIYAAVMDL